MAIHADEGRAPEGKGAQTRRAILEAAIVRFGRDGYRATSVAHIARDAGVGPTLAYAYFPNKEALFLAAVDEDAARVMGEGLVGSMGWNDVADWRQLLLVTLIGALDDHPLARRLLAGLEPEVTARVLEIPALAELRKVCAERLAADQLSGRVRPDIDPVTMANGVVAVVLSLLMSVVQLGADTVAHYGSDVVALFEAALEAPPTLRARGTGPSAG
ncbi:MAG TPA: TetR/AcrR family transcriptional regulator [Acidimicrobiales bacterium]|nr:TetR/AcrR family transcriptional regulator [Acidimicrobiales bacterium]